MNLTMCLWTRDKEKLSILTGSFLKSDPVISGMLGFTVLERRHVCRFSKCPEKVSQIVEATVQADFQYRTVRFPQKGDGFFDAHFVDVCHGGLAYGLFEETAEILLIHINQFCQITDIDFFRIIFMNIGQDFLNRLYTVVRTSLTLGEEAKIAEDGQYPKQGGFDAQLGREEVGT